MNVHAVGRPVPFAHFSQFLKMGPSEEKPSGSRKRSCSGPTDPDVLEALKARFPWLTLDQILEMLGKVSTQGGSTRPGPSAGSSAGGGSSLPVPDDLPEDVLAEVSAQLAGLKDECSGFDEEDTFFTVRVLGGTWSIAQRRMPCTDIGAYAIEKSTQVWCSGVGWPARNSFAVKNIRVWRIPDF